jgi:hypothetical protein
MCTLLLAAIPMAAGMAIPKENKTQTTGLLDITILRGIVLFKHVTDNGKTLRFFAVRVHYMTMGPLTGFKTGVLKLRPVAIPNSIRGMFVRFYIFSVFHGDVVT